ncbi:uncharacterized protein LOC106506844 isoform X1 [Sus scrofa]|uniref:uncharacterized protein LOC106506844 isoform X1 n=1 Tax=Sus scrofa TaxID=9823 RepID=UPI0006B15FDC|nr:uncharacterized protein LOC106506844 isoform X1 [Sus scrofa]
MGPDFQAVPRSDEPETGWLNEKGTGDPRRVQDEVQQRHLGTISDGSRPGHMTAVSHFLEIQDCLLVLYYLWICAPRVPLKCQDGSSKKPSALASLCPMAQHPRLDNSHECHKKHLEHGVLLASPFTHAHTLQDYQGDPRTPLKSQFLTQDLTTALQMEMLDGDQQCLSEPPSPPPSPFPLFLHPSPQRDRLPLAPLLHLWQSFSVLQGR